MNLVTVEGWGEGKFAGGVARSKKREVVKIGNVAMAKLLAPVSFWQKKKFLFPTLLSWTDGRAQDTYCAHIVLLSYTHDQIVGSV